jgi:hypothetical protein
MADLGIRRERAKLLRGRKIALTLRRAGFLPQNSRAVASRPPICKMECHLRRTDRLGKVGKWPKKGDRHHLCEVPEGPFRQMVPVPFFRPLSRPERGS